MAEKNTDDEDKSSEEDCPICLESLVHACKLPCGHVFCFLCIKGTFNFTPKCSLCRTAIPNDYLNKPDLIDKSSISDDEDEHVWYYQGKNGWWQYDERTNNLIETEFNNKIDQFQIQIAGQMYLIDFENQYQIRFDNNRLKRRIKRDFKTRDIKGVAGISANHMK